jgi:hypothetical protein
MPELNLSFATEPWFEQVFPGPPARKVKGRTKWTHRHAPWVEYLNRFAYVESRNELIGLLALEYLQRQGLLRRFKEQPFTTPRELWVAGMEPLSRRGQPEYTPDFLTESPTGNKYVIEVKSARYISRQMEHGFELWKAKFGEYGLKYLVWTDRDALALPLRQNLIRLRRVAVEYFEQDELSRLISVLQSNGPMPIWALYKQDLDLNLIDHAAWHGKVFFPLRETIADRTLVSLNRTEDLVGNLLGIEPDMYAWWNALEAA